MKTVGDIRSSGVITVYGGKQFKANYQDLVELSHEVRDGAVYHAPVPVQDEDGNAVGSIFAHHQFPEVKRLILHISQNEYQIRTEDFALMMAEGQLAAQIIDVRTVQLAEGQATLEAVFS